MGAAGSGFDVAAPRAVGKWPRVRLIHASYPRRRPWFGARRQACNQTAGGHRSMRTSNPTGPGVTVRWRVFPCLPQRPVRLGGGRVKPTRGTGPVGHATPALGPDRVPHAGRPAAAGLSDRFGQPSAIFPPPSERRPRRQALGGVPNTRRKTRL